MRTPFTILTLILIYVFTADPYSGQAQNKSINIKGKVANEAGEPLAGVTVNIKGRGQNTVTDASGNYSVMVADKKAVLVFSFVGLTTQEIPVRNQTEINIQLVPDSKSMEEVVVTALNIKRSKKSLGYSIATLDGGEVDKVQTPNLINALSGKVAGLDVGNIANGVAGSKRVVIRGGSSLTGNNQPLWVIDGIPINTTSLGETNSFGERDYGDGLAGINPDDIETISVLKGNAAAALYGSRAANGVILVTTKSGKSGNGKMKVEVSSSLLLDKLKDATDFQDQYGQTSLHRSEELPTSAEDAYTSDSWGHKLDGTPAPQFDGVVRPFSAAKHGYEDFFRTGSTINNTVALSGSSANHEYRVSLSDLRNTDIVPNSNFTRTSINTKTHSTFGKLDVDVVLDYIYQRANGRPYIGGNHENQFYSLLYLPTNVDVKDLAPGYDSTGREVDYASSITNPYYIVNKQKERDIRNQIIGSIDLKYQITPFLYARGMMSRYFDLSKILQYTPDKNITTSYPGGSLYQRSLDQVENNYQAMLGVNTINIGKLGISGFVGGNVKWYTATQLVESGNTFVVPDVYSFNNLANKLPSTVDTKQRTNSLFGSVELSYNKYLYLTLTGRNDWFSTLPLTSNNLLYPSAALSFVFSDALKLPSSISFGKLRASTAQVSGETEPYQLDLSYALDPLAYGSLPLQTIGTSTIPNKNLKPALSTDFEIGLEMSFLNNRIGFDIDYYKKTVKDVIVESAVSNTTGYNSAILNVGKLADNGVELLLNGVPIREKNFTWSTTVTFSTNSNRVIKLGSGAQGANIQIARSKDANAAVLLEEGEKYGQIYGTSYKRDSLGRKIITSDGLPQANASTTRLGNILYNKLLGFSNTFTYKSFSLYVFLDGKFGADFYSETNVIAYNNGKHKATLVGREDGFVADGVDEDGKANTVPIRGYQSAVGSGAYVNQYYKRVSNIAEQFVYDASFLKLREIALSYNLPKSLLHGAGITNASVSVVARNLLTVYKDKNLENVDPESSVSSGNGQGIETLVYPVPKSYGITLKLGL